jgi:glyoxylase-like metal-dependent hydrolase (beta-lactamase superfamily II)
MTGRWLELGDGVFARRYAELDLSVGLVVGDGHCLIVDTRGDLAQGAELAAAVRKITPAPWTVAITHAHWDHCFGTTPLLPCEVWAHDLCHADLAATGTHQRDDVVRMYREQGRPDAADRVAEVEPVLPDHLVTHRATLSVGGRLVVLAHFGPGHTDHDLVVQVPDAGVVFAGDLVEQGAPPAFEDAFPLAWPTAVDGILGLAPRTVSPGHGEPVDAGFVTGQRAELAVIAGLCDDVTTGRRSVTDALGRSPYPDQVLRTAIDRTRSTRAAVAK